MASLENACKSAPINGAGITKNLIMSLWPKFHASTEASSEIPSSLFKTTKTTLKIL